MNYVLRRKKEKTKLSFNSKEILKQLNAKPEQKDYSNFKKPVNLSFYFYSKNFHGNNNNPN